MNLSNSCISSPLSPVELDHSCELKSSDSNLLEEEMRKLRQQYQLKYLVDVVDPTKHIWGN